MKHRSKACTAFVFGIGVDIEMMGNAHGRFASKRQVLSVHYSTTADATKLVRRGYYQLLFH